MSRPLVLVVAMANSVHVVRWVAALRRLPVCTVLVSSTRAEPLAALRPIRPVLAAAEAQALPEGTIGLYPVPSENALQPPDDLPVPIGMIDRRFLLRGAEVAAAIGALQPALVHAMELQHAGYACLAASRLPGGGFPPWMVSNWGSDIQLYRKLAAHAPVLEALLRRVDLYVGECARDSRSVRELGYRGPAVAPIPASGGVDFAALPRLDALPPTSARRMLLVKGYHGWSGRAHHILSAIHLAAPALSGCAIRVTHAEAPVAAAVSTLRQRDGLDIALEPFAESHAVALARVGAARATVGLGISDGIGTTMLEAMALGSFPIAGNTSCIDEWLEHGRDGLIVDPHDVAAIAQALTRAMADDALVDAAALRNRAEVEQRWDLHRNAAAIAALYRMLLGDRAAA